MNAPAAPAKIEQPGAPAAAPAPGAPAKPAAPAAPAPGAPAAAAPGAPAKPANALADGAEPGAAAAPAAAAVWPDDWREQAVGADDKLLARLKRYASPRDVVNALFSAQNRISSGELKAALPENATPEQAAAWRAENGIPAEPKGYELPEGITVGEDDKPVIESFLKFAHGANFRPEAVKGAIEWWFNDREQQIEALVKADDDHRIEAVEAMTAHWGQDRKRNQAMINALIDTAPPAVATMLRAARGPDDKALMNDFGVLEWLQTLAFQINPVSAVVPGATGDVMETITSEIEALEKEMKDPNSDYWGGKGQKDKVGAEKKQARYRELIAARDRPKT